MATDDAERHGRTSGLELTDRTLREWDAVVLDASPEGIVLDRSAFYPGGGGQPPDHGVLLWGGVQTRIVGVRRADDLVLVPAEGDPVPPAVAVVLAAHGGFTPSARTLQRHFAAAGFTRTRPDGAPPAVFGRFEAERPNARWVGDALHGPATDS